MKTTVTAIDRTPSGAAAASMAKPSVSTTKSDDVVKHEASKSINCAEWEQNWDNRTGRSESANCAERERHWNESMGNVAKEKKKGARNVAHDGDAGEVV